MSATACQQCVCVCNGFHPEFVMNAIKGVVIKPINTHLHIFLMVPSSSHMGLFKSEMSTLMWTFHVHILQNTLYNLINS